MMAAEWGSLKSSAEAGPCKHLGVQVQREKRFRRGYFLGA